MGFHVRVDDVSERLIRLVKTDPSKIFGRLYSAYLLFLIGERDELELKWLLENAKALDSLTGRHVAYAVFAKKFTVRLQTHSLASDRTPGMVGHVNAAEIQELENVTRLVKDGKFGMVVDGDEITAITYGTDLIARELGLLDKLPCIVVVDAVPSKDICVVKLDNEVTASLMSLLRKSIAEFSSSSGDKTIRRDAEQILEIQGEIDQEHQRDAELRSKIARESDKLAKLRVKINSGYATSDPNFLAEIANSRERVIQELTTELDRLPEEQPARLARYESDLQTVLNEHKRHRSMLFSKILESELRALGMHSKLGAAKAGALSFVGSLLKPDVLLKVWGAIHS